MSNTGRRCRFLLGGGVLYPNEPKSSVHSRLQQPDMADWSVSFARGEPQLSSSDEYMPRKKQLKRLAARAHSILVHALTGQGRAICAYINSCASFPVRFKGPRKPGAYSHRV